MGNLTGFLFELIHCLIKMKKYIFKIIVGILRIES
jgi:hypothetical protein